MMLRRQERSQQKRFLPLQLTAFAALVLLLMVAIALQKDLFKSLDLSRALTTSSSTSTLPPPMQGGVLVFLHTPKTGGTTVRETLSGMPGVRLAGVYVSHQLKSVQRQVQEQLTGTSASDATLVVEIHDRSSSHLRELAPLLRQWRRQASQNNKPFYAFTLLRDPIDYAISLFNFFFVLGGLFGNERYPSLNGTLEHFRQVLLPKLFNPQCTYFLQGELFADDSKRVTQHDCNWVAATLRETMDWVGDTKSLSRDTLPHLQYLLTGTQEVVASSSAYESRKMMPAKTSDTSTKVLLQKKDLDVSTAKAVVEKSQLDQALFASTVIEGKDSSWSL